MTDLTTAAQHVREAGARLYAVDACVLAQYRAACDALDRAIAVETGPSLDVVEQIVAAIDDRLRHHAQQLEAEVARLQSVNAALRASYECRGEVIKHLARERWSGEQNRFFSDLLRAGSIQ